jgi:hypothetical protein
VVNGLGGTPNKHDALTGTAPDRPRLPAWRRQDLPVVSTDWAATPGQYKLTFSATIEQASATLAGKLVVTPPRGDTGDAAKDDNNDDSGSSSSSSSPLTISLPVDVALSLGFGVLAALGLSALVVFRRPAAVAVAGTQSRPRLAAWPGRWVAVMLATGFVLSLLLVGGGVLARKDGMRQAMGGVVGLLH